MVTSKSIGRPVAGVSTNTTRRMFNLLSSRKTKRINLSGKKKRKYK
jgi:hypothetical protein